MLDFPTTPANLTAVNAIDAPTFIYRTTGTRWRSGPGSILLEKREQSAAIEHIFALPAGFRWFNLKVRGMWTATASTVIYARFSYDGGATYLSAGGNYNYAGEYVYSGAVAFLGTSMGGNSSSIQLGTTLTTTAGHPSLLDIDINPGNASLLPNIRSRWGVLYPAGSTMFLAIGGYSGAGRITNIKLFSANVASFTFRQAELSGMP